MYDFPSLLGCAGRLDSFLAVWSDSRSSARVLAPGQVTQ